MTSKEIFRIARKAGLLTSGDDWIRIKQPSLSEFKHFARLIMEVERESCAKMCEDAAEKGDPFNSYARKALATAIRARGKQ
jgi:hypothetical protein